MNTFALNTVFFFALFFLLFSRNVFAQDDDLPVEESIIDKVANYIEIRKSFDSRTETTKPALFSYKKIEDEPAIYTVDAAVLYKKFDYSDFAVFPAVQFLYTSGGKKKRELIEFSLFGLLFLYKNSSGKGRLEPSISFSKDFFTDERILKTKLLFNPSYDGFFIPIRNVTHYKFKYNGKDNRWIFGVNPIIGFGYESSLEDNTTKDEQSFYNVANISMSLKRYYFEVTVYGDYNQQFDDDRKSYYKYGGIISLYLDVKERSSINAKIEKERKKGDHDTEISFGFGLRL